MFFSGLKPIARSVVVAQSIQQTPDPWNLKAKIFAFLLFHSFTLSLFHFAQRLRLLDGTLHKLPELRHKADVAALVWCMRALECRSAADDVEVRILREDY